MAKPAVGECVAQYEFSKAGYAKLGAIMAGCAIVGGGMIVGSISSNDSNIPGRVILFILGLLFLLPVGLGIYGLSRGRKNAVRVHENGVVVFQAGSEDEVLFDDIVTYSNEGFLSIVTRDEDSIDFGLDGLSNSKDLFLRLREGVVVKRQLPKLLKALATGEVVEFGGEEPRPPNDAGGYSLDAQGITLATSKRRIAWNEIVEVGSETVVRGPGNLQPTVVSVFIKTNSETFEAAVEPLSQRELMMAACNEMKAKMMAG